MKPLPLFFDLSRTKALIIGGGRIALRKAKAFLEAGATLTVIAPEILPEFEGLANVETIRKMASLQDVSKDYNFVIVATNSEATNRLISDECRRTGVLCCRADDFMESDFFLAGTLQREAITLGIFSSGVPEMTRFLKEHLYESISPEIVTLAGFVAELRPLIKEKITDEAERKKFFSNLVSKQMIGRIAAEGIDKIREEVMKCL